MLKRFNRPLAALALFALAACGGGGGGTSVAPPANPPNLGPTGPLKPPAAPASLVGIGDSLTAGYQSSGFLGDPNVTSTLSAYPGGIVPPGQEAGFWADLYNAMVGVPNAATQVMPLIKGPGLADQLVLNATTLFANTHLACDAFNQSAFSPTGWENTRLDPSATPLNLGVPGITMHEAVSMTGPLTGPQTPNSSGTGCNPYTTIAGDPTSGGLQSLVAGESLMFYPVLGNFEALGTNTTMLSAATALRPQMATVWLGANDLLKFAFSNEQSPVTDTPQQFAADLTQIVSTLAKGGTKVLLAELPTLIPAQGQGRAVPQFFSSAAIGADLTQLLVATSGGQISPAAGQAYATGAITALETNDAANLPASGGWYLTETGFLGLFQQTVAAVTANPLAPDFSKITLDPTTAGSGAGGAYLTVKLVGDLQALNAAYNQVIDQVAASSGPSVALVPINALFQQAATTGVPVGTHTFTLQFGGGLVSWDGLHPSNTGYAVIANAFIATANAKFGTTMTPIDLTTVAATDLYNPYILGPSPFPLP